MRKHKPSLESEFRRLNIPFWKHGDGYCLWYDDPADVKTKRECWQIVNGYSRQNKYRELAKKTQNRRIRYDRSDNPPIYKKDRWLWT